MSRTSTLYLNLRETLQTPGCPLCRMGSASGRRYLDALLFESVNDPDIRAKLATAFGFCGRHHREMLTFQGERLGVAIIERALLAEALGRMEGSGAAQAGRRRLWRRGGGETADEGGAAPAACPACAEEAAAEDRLLPVLLKHLEGDLDAALRQAGGLCWRHFWQALAATSDTNTKTALVRLHRQAWEELAGHLDEFIRKRDYRFSHEAITPAEARAIENAIAILGGK